MYHGIDQVSDRSLNSRHISQGEFQRHLLFFKRHFSVVSLEEIFAKEPERHAPKPRLAITFDDGFYNNFEFAVPLLEQQELPATIFVTALGCLGEKLLWADALDIFAKYFTGQSVEGDGLVFRRHPGRLYDPFLDDSGRSLKSYLKTLPRQKKAPWLQHLAALVANWQSCLEQERTYWQLIDPAQLGRFKSSWVKIGSHGLSHDNLGNLDLDASMDELCRSKAWLEERVGYPIVSLAYPDGSYSREVLKAARQLGYTIQLATAFRDVADKAEPDLADRVGLYSFNKFEENMNETIKWAVRHVS